MSGHTLNILDYAQPTATGGDGFAAEDHAVYAEPAKSGWWKLPLITAALVIVLLAVILYLVRDVLPQRIANNGWTLITMPGCGACTKQDEILGYYGYLIPHYPCSGAGEYLGDAKTPPPIPCKSVTAFPTWYNTKTKKTVTAVQNEIALAKMAE